MRGTTEELVGVVLCWGREVREERTRRVKESGNDVVCVFQIFFLRYIGEKVESFYCVHGFSGNI